MKDLSALPLADLKKIKKAYEAYPMKVKKHETDCALVEARNSRIEQHNKLVYDQALQWDKNMAPLYEEKFRIEHALSECRVGFFANLLTDSFEYKGTRYKTNPGKKLVQKLFAKEIKINVANQSKPQFNLLPKESPPRFPKTETSLKVGGATLKININSLNIQELNDLIKQHEQGLENEKNKLIELQARAATSEKETRQQAQKFRRDLHKQLAAVPCCPYCGGSLTDNNAHLDHIYPVSKGGKSTNQNLVFACSKCNLNKKAMTLRSFILKSGSNELEIHERLETLTKDF